MTSVSSDADDLCGNCLHTRDKHGGRGGPGEVCWATNAIFLFDCQCERFEERP